MATAARDSGATRLRRPVAWLGSTSTGRCVNSLSTATAVMSHVFRVAGYNADPWEVQLAGATTTEHVFEPRLPINCP